MSLPDFHKDRIDISNHLDFPHELLSLPAARENYILVVGPDLVRREAAPGQGHTHTYLERLLKGMVVWCTQHKVIQDQDIIHDLHILLHNGALVPLAYMLEEYLADTRLKEQCLTAVLSSYSRVEAIHYGLTSRPFRRYITTGYDTCIETAYEETQQGELSKYYQSSLSQAIEASQKKQPFILKLYGDLARPDSIKPGRRLLTGLYAGDVRQQLRQLFCETPSIFIGFDDADQDLIALQSLIPGEYNNRQNPPAHSGEQHDGRTPESSNRSSPDSATYESFPGYFLAQPFKSVQNLDITAKNEQTKREKAPDATRRETIEIPASDKKYRSNGLHGDSLPPRADSRSDSDNWNGRIQNQTQKSSNSASRKASAGKKPPPDFDTLVSKGDFQLPKVGDIGKLESALRNDYGYLNIQVAEKPGETAYNGELVKYTLVTRGTEPRALIYIPGSTISEPKPIERKAISGLCDNFPPNTILIICTDSEKCDPVVARTIRAKQNRKIVLWGEIQQLLKSETKTEQKSWVYYILEYED